VILSYQTPTGGWSKHTGYSRGPRQPGMLFSSQFEPGRSPHYLGTFDNRSTTEQIWFLTYVAQATGRADCGAAVERGLKYILAAQYPNGGWPQVYPLEGDYHDAITLNDDAMTHVLEVLHAVNSGDPAFATIEKKLREDCARALTEGLRCIVAAQVVVEGRKTGWCAQHDALTLEPVGARALEPPTLSGLESAQVVKFLMSIEAPSQEVIQSIEGCLAWLEEVKIKGLTRTEIDGKTAYVEDPSSTSTFWARFYDLTSGRPVFPGRDGVSYKSFAEMAAKNRLGYDYYSTLPDSIVTNGQKKWRKKMAK
jgi:PelA/Pel-15E family pectate lyase